MLAQHGLHLEGVVADRVAGRERRDELVDRRHRRGYCGDGRRRPRSARAARLHRAPSRSPRSLEQVRPTSPAWSGRPGARSASTGSSRPHASGAVPTSASAPAVGRARAAARSASASCAPRGSRSTHADEHQRRRARRRSTARRWSSDSSARTSSPVSAGGVGRVAGGARRRRRRARRRPAAGRSAPSPHSATSDPAGLHRRGGRRRRRRRSAATGGAVGAAPSSSRTAGLGAGRGRLERLDPAAEQPQRARPSMPAKAVTCWAR